MAVDSKACRLDTSASDTRVSDERVNATLPLSGTVYKYRGYAHIHKHTYAYRIMQHIYSQQLTELLAIDI